MYLTCTQQTSECKGYSAAHRVTHNEKMKCSELTAWNLSHLVLHRLIAHDKKELRKLGITHVLNAAHSAWGSKGDQGFYGPEIHYHGIAAEDSTDFNLRMHFYPASKYINKALSVLNGKSLLMIILHIYVASFNQGSQTALKASAKPYPTLMGGKYYLPLWVGPN